MQDTKEVVLLKKVNADLGVVQDAFGQVIQLLIDRGKEVTLESVLNDTLFQFIVSKGVKKEELLEYIDITILFDSKELIAEQYDKAKMQYLEWEDALKEMVHEESDIQ